MTETSKPDIYGGDPTTTTRSWWAAVKRGFRKKCPRCGTGRSIKGYSKVHDDCTTCGLHLAGHRADDMPPYITMVISGHLIIPLALELERRVDPPLGIQFLIWAPVLLLLTFWLLPRVKGAIIGLQWANRMHGFSETPDEDLEESLK